MYLYFKIELPVSANQDEIRNAFRRLSKLYHPDRNPGSRHKFEKINNGIFKNNNSLRNIIR